MDGLIAEKILSIYMPRSVAEACEALTGLAMELVTGAVSVIALTPRSFRRRLYIWPQTEATLASANLYVDSMYKEDIWFERSPIGPTFTVVRHSDYTPEEVLMDSNYFQSCLVPISCMHGVSVTAWEGKNWLATLTVFKAIGDGDFSNSELDFLRQFHPHFARCVYGFSQLAELNCKIESLETYIKSSPTAFVLLDWSLEVVTHNHAARWRVYDIEAGPKAVMKPDRRFQLPEPVRRQIEQIKLDLIENKISPDGVSENIIGLDSNSVEGRVSFLPSQSGVPFHGSFLVTLDRKGPMADSPHLANLSPTERTVFRLLEEGLSNKEIANSLNKSIGTVKKQVQSMMKKSKVTNRIQLIRALTTGLVPAEDFDDASKEYDV